MGHTQATAPAQPPKDASGAPAAPFACSVDAGFVDIVRHLGCTLAVSTYQAGKVILLGSAPPWLPAPDPSRDAR